MQVTASPCYLTPPAVAKRLGVKPGRIIGWIRSGQLRAVDLSERPGAGRPRFKIDPADLVIFLNQRAVTPIPKPSRRRRRADPGVIQFF